MLPYCCSWCSRDRHSHALLISISTVLVAQIAARPVTAQVCVQTTMREANDRGYECLLVTDATARWGWVPFGEPYM